MMIIGCIVGLKQIAEALREQGCGTLAYVYIQGNDSYVDGILNDAV